VNIKQERKHIPVLRMLDLLEEFLHDYVPTSSVAVVVVETFHYLLFVSVARY